MPTVLVDTDDLGVAEAALSANYAKIRMSALAAPATRVRVTSTEIGKVAAQRSEFGFGFRYDMDPLEKVVICLVEAGAAEQRLPAQPPETGGPGDVVAYGVRDDLSFSGSVRAGRFSQLLLDRTLFDEVAAAAPNDDGAPVRLTALQPVSAPANAHLAGLIAYVRDNDASDPFVAENPMVAGAVQRYVAATVLSAFPSTALLDPTAGDRRDGTPVLLRRAISFIEDNTQRDISLTDIAQAVYVTPRALQYMFRKHRDCTPTEYLRRVRLHHAHLDLIAGNRAATTVAQIARKWGFLHTSRFAVYYRQAYGQSPHVTLRG
ncbi:helix-turn-helix transcriptional regulator [Mycolicibacterium sp. 120266]|uniref:helix-turn-helix transcriptional regulator n=1 Tax=Mycolicibacterium sp. 120266 TaxID=3090601 RepID=UPI00299D2AB2|nr:helix-turn-helix transcriptional regulator [Mycolicibacterium sp. 120266]MDX1872492.1 helix-turn-helix transcriptional regulator [Mycolicibacterium sp. 120266]